MDLSIVVPCYNEEGNVELFYEEVQKVFKGKKLNMELFLSMMVVVTIL